MDSRRNYVRYGRTIPQQNRTVSRQVVHHDETKNDTEQQMLTAYTLAMVYAPTQCFGNLYDLDSAIAHGTIFKDLNMPFAPGKRC